MKFELNGGGGQAPYKAHMKLSVAVSLCSGAVMYARKCNGDPCCWKTFLIGVISFVSTYNLEPSN
jgi:hypothetical protein